LVFLVSLQRPILAWQVPMVTSAVLGAFNSRDVGEPRDAKGLLGVALLIWVMSFLLSLPWVLVFQRRMQRASQEPNVEVVTAASYIGVGLLAFLASALVILGLILSFMMHDSVDPRDGSVPWEGFLMATLGIGVAVAACRIAARLGAAKPVEDVLGLVFSFFGIPGLLDLIASLWERPKSPSGLPRGGLVRPSRSGDFGRADLAPDQIQTRKKSERWS
jgi:hypothetical protein